MCAANTARSGWTSSVFVRCLRHGHSFLSNRPEEVGAESTAGFEDEIVFNRFYWRRK